MRARRWARDPVAVGLVIGFLADRAFGDPRRHHPVAGFGQVAAHVEQRAHAQSRGRGALAATSLVSATVVIALVERRLPTPARVLVGAAATWAVLGGRSLEREGDAIAELLGADDLTGARLRIRNLVGRNPSNLGADEIARACVESIAENSADAVVAPLFWGAVAGVPGLVGYRAVNTLDAMWGHRNDRYREFGWAAARLDDVANWLPARLTVGLNTTIAAGFSGLQGAWDVVRTVQRDAPAHPSPNAGPVEASWAAALGVRLGGTNHYDGVDEDRGHLGDGKPVSAADIPRATRHLRRLSTAALLTVVGARVASRHWPQRAPRTR
ncbi:cobalamin biosynthesis protein CobD [Knoellia sinensis KCTC 19936]|uniref:Cobalamin biosynthesis protein CobD n=2 Tax=Knoellia TaxID=136099 RepID=A0A0A0J780_9MICO|nr:cobalamin biosynthesis protein CobD [Knoellia sinensis KCTC 19936]